MENIQLVAGMFTCIWMHVFISLYKGRMLETMIAANSFTWEDLLTRDDAKVNFKMTIMVALVKKYSQRYLQFLVVFHVFYCCFRLSFTDSETTINSYHYIDINYSPVRELVIFFQIVGAAAGVAIFINTMGAFGMMVSIACSQLEKISADLLDIKQTKIALDHNSQIEKDIITRPSNKDLLKMHSKFRDCIRHHQKTTAFMKSLEKLFSPMLLGSLSCIVFGSCLSAFSAILVCINTNMHWGEVLQITQCLLIYIGLMIELSYICWFGQELTNQAGSLIRNAVWDSDWIGAPVSHQRSLIFTLAMVSKDFRLTAGKIVPIGRPTLVSVMNQTASYFMFLLNVHKK